MATRKGKQSDAPEDVTAPDETVEKASTLPVGQPVAYVLNEGANAGAVRPAVLVDVGGLDPRIVVQTEPGDELPQPMTLSLTQYIGGATAPTYNADQRPGTWYLSVP